MARIAIRAVVHIIAYPLVMAVGRRLVVRVARYAGEDRVIARIGVAIGTGGPLAVMRAGVDGEPGVVESRTQPGRRVVTRTACSRERSCDVVRIRYALIVGLVTRVTIGRRAGVLTIHVTTGTSDLDMRSRERECRGRMIERRRLPCGGVVAHRAIRREARCDMVRTLRTVVIVLVARHAGSAQSSVFAAGVARDTGKRNVRAGQRELGL